MYENVRYPFVITDDAGYAIFNYPHLIENDKCFFSSENFSPEELTFFFGRIREYRLNNLIILRERKKGKTVFVSPFAFSSTRTLIALVSDIDYDTAAYICAFSLNDVAMSCKVDKMPRKDQEKSYESICTILHLLKSATYACSEGEDFYKYLFNMVESVSHMTFCKANVDFNPGYSMPCPDNFDSGILSLYLMIMMSAASFASGERSAKINFSTDRDAVCASVSFSALMDKKLLSDFEEKFSSAVARIDSICAENNLPMYFYRDGIFKSGIIPCRIENSLIGLKARAGFLKDEQEQEQKERNIFLSALTTADE